MKRTTFKVVHEYTFSLDIGELPEHSIAAVLEKDISESPPIVFFGGTDWGVGEGADRGTSANISVSVSPV